MCTTDASVVCYNTTTNRMVLHFPSPQRPLFTVRLYVTPVSFVQSLTIPPNSAVQRIGEPGRILVHNQVVTMGAGWLPRRCYAQLALCHGVQRTAVPYFYFLATQGKIQRPDQLQSAPAPPVGLQHSCRPTVKLHILPLVWIFTLEMGYYGGAGGSSWDLPGHSLVAKSPSLCAPPARTHAATVGRADITGSTHTQQWYSG